MTQIRLLFVTRRLNPGTYELLIKLRGLKLSLSVSFSRVGEVSKQK